MPFRMQEAEPSGLFISLPIFSMEVLASLSMYPLPFSIDRRVSALTLKCAVRIIEGGIFISPLKFLIPRIISLITET